MVASAMAVDFSGRVVLDADILAGGVNSADKFEVSGPVVKTTNQKDGDALQVNVSGEKAGASFKMWYAADGSDDALTVRGANIWFKPIDMLKVSVGNVSAGTYCEQINWWHGLTAESTANLATWGGAGAWTNKASIDGFGAMVDVNVGNLWLNAGFAPGADETLFSNGGYGAYGVAAKYTIMDGLTAAVSWADNGKDAAKLLKVGADYSNGGLYAFENVIVNINKDGVTGLGFDTYVAFSAGAFKVQASLPVVIRLTDVATDNSYMMFDVKASYGFGAATLYCRLADTDGPSPIEFSDAMNFAMLINPGVAFNVGECSIDIGVKANVADKFSFSVPVSMSVNL